MPIRPERLPYDHCPQLAALDRPQDVEVRLESGTRPYVDIDLYRFALTEDFVTRTVAGFPRRLLRTDNECRELLMPPGPTMWVEFGIDEERLRERWVEARFLLTVRLSGYGYKRVTMCVATEAEGEMEKPLSVVAWGNPLVSSSIQHPYEKRAEILTEQERKLREQQLQALGYVQ
jgi:hypothetical protein